MRRTLVTLFASLFTLPAGAADVGISGFEGQLSAMMDIRSTVKPDSDWQGIVGAGAGVRPKFPGSEDYEVTLLPGFDVEWRGAYFLSTHRGLGLNFFRGPTFKAGPRLTYDFGRDSSESNFLRGLPDIDAGAELGVFGEALFGDLRLRSDLRKGLSEGGHNGYVLTIDGAYGGQVNDQLRIVLGGFTHYVTEEFMQKYFDVSVGAAGRPVFRSSGGGLTDLGVYLNMHYSVTERAFVSFATRGATFIGDAADSPISQQDLQYFLGLSVGYRF
jgi:outer membrane protein